MAGGESSLCEATRSGNLEQVRQMLGTGEDVNQRDQHGETPLIIAACLGYTKVEHLTTDLTDLTLSILQIVSALLVSEEISVNMKTPEGWTALVAAADKGHHDLVKTLLKNKKVDVNVRDNQSEYTSLSVRQKDYNVLVMILASVVLTYPSLLHYRRNESYCNVINQRKCGELLIPENFHLIFILSLAQ